MEAMTKDELVDRFAHILQVPRYQVAQLWPLVVAFVAAFIAENASDSVEGESLAAHWRREMGE